MSKFLKLLTKAAGDDAVIATEGVPSGDIIGFTDTGSYALNMLISGDMNKGLPKGKVTALAGEEATGKTFIALAVVKNFLDSDPDAICFYFEDEGSITQDLLESRGIATDRLVVVPVTTIQDFRYRVLNVLNEYEKDKNRPPMLMVLDSLGNLSTTKEIEDMEAGKETRDMTKQQLIRGAFRVITLKLSKLQVPMLVTCHTYQVVGSMFPTREVGGGGGLKYAATNIILLSKAKDKDGTEVVGNIITCKNDKSRLTKENAKVKIRLTYETGLDPYYGLVDIALDCGVFTNISNKIQIVGTETSVFEKKIINNPEKYFTEDVLTAINEKAKSKFLYGAGEVSVEEEGEAE